MKTEEGKEDREKKWEENREVPKGRNGEGGWTFKKEETRSRDFLALLCVPGVETPPSSDFRRRASSLSQETTSDII